MNIIFDLDGTLIDSRLRLYQLFQKLVPESRLDYIQYWDFKFAGLSNEAILSRQFGLGETQVIEFRERWMDLIESPEFLSIDTNFPGVHAALSRLKSEAKLYVCTARQLVDPVYVQLESLKLLEYFESVMVTEQRNTKDFLISQNVKDLSSADWVIGDTGKDIQVGAALGMSTCAVLTGFMKREALLKYCPSRVVESVIDFAL
ncbi:HAD family hydrolase [Pseudomonas sp. AF03-9]|uniref:HAD family hydrolase n=1 Tax=Pseudomonas sp. AF03-9 TaxID=2849867 RepID=UPI001CFBE761|nr:HAD hydrolase-like protein [Pseudomonas sp. AF03-9]